MTINPTHKLDLSPEARAALKQYLPLYADQFGNIHAANGQHLGTFIYAFRDYTVDSDVAAFFAALVNAALTPAPVVTVEPETTAELGQLITTEFEAAERWTAADILEREG